MFCVYMEIFYTGKLNINSFIFLSNISGILFLAQHTTGRIWIKYRNIIYVYYTYKSICSSYSVPSFQKRGGAAVQVGSPPLFIPLTWLLLITRLLPLTAHLPRLVPAYLFFMDEREEHEISPSQRFLYKLHLRTPCTTNIFKISLAPEHVYSNG